MLVKYFYKLFQKLVFKDQWIIGIMNGSINDIFNNKNWVSRITWIRPPTLNTFYADPFLLFAEGDYKKIIFEEFQFNEDYGKICLLTLNKKNKIINKKLLLDTKIHLSYPFIFKENNKIFIFPESAQSGKVCCYEFDPREEKLNFVKDILYEPLLDSTILKKNNQYWLFGVKGDNRLGYKQYVYISDNLFGPFYPHQENPINGGFDGIRSAGNFFNIGDETFRPTQNCRKKYGDSITINKIKITKDLVEEENYYTICTPKNKFNVHSIHTINVMNNYIVIDAKAYAFSPFHQFLKFKRNLKKKQKKE